MSNGERLVKAETNRNQPTNGDIQIALASVTIKAASQLSSKDTAPHIR